MCETKRSSLNSSRRQVPEVSSSLIWAILGAVAAGLAVLVTVLLQARHVRAEHALLERMKQDKENQDVTYATLQELYELGINDPAKVEQARQILLSYADQLSKGERADIWQTLAQGSDRSKANYIAKLIGEERKEEEGDRKEEQEKEDDSDVSELHIQLTIASIQYDRVVNIQTVTDYGAAGSPGAGRV